MPFSVPWQTHPGPVKRDLVHTSESRGSEWPLLGTAAGAGWGFALAPCQGLGRGGRSLLGRDGRSLPLSVLILLREAGGEAVNAV